MTHWLPLSREPITGIESETAADPSNIQLSAKCHTAGACAFGIRRQVRVHVRDIVGLNLKCDLSFIKGGI